jgi:alpha-L-fucosidase
MKRRTLLKTMAGVVPAIGLSPSFAKAFLPGGTYGESVAKGPFTPDWASLAQYKVPGWFRDAKFGIWAHWGPQCQPEHGDWYARSMYIEGDEDYDFHIKKYGHPSTFGFKDVIHTWKAENWDPAKLLELYKRAGAKYFVALANHHDNFDNYHSKYQPAWNAVNMGPKKDLIGGWAKAARAQGLHFGVSVHASHAWMFYEKAQKADTKGALAGVPYDGKITKADGKNKWWDGIDPQELYAQNHALSIDGDIQETFYQQWDWSHGANVPDKKYCEKFFNRTIDLINQHNPDLVYFDDTVLPLWPISDAGLRIAAHLYNKSINQYGSLEAVINGKILNAAQRECMVWDIERGQSDGIEPLPWQTDTCIGNWHYDRRVYDNHGYKSAATIVQSLADIVSKNGNLLLSIPVRGDGTIDDQELAIVEEIAVWMKDNDECIFGTRPWKIFGEGPASASAAALSAQGFNEGTGKPFTAEDIRFTTKGNVLYAIALGAPADENILIKSLADGSTYYPGAISKVTLCGSNEALHFTRSRDGLAVTLPMGAVGKYGCALKVLEG